ncbi:phage tail protein [Tardiphaga sp. 1201_B9_N1_2]|uniref:phage tail protein n=1 Tax=Tardiphaga sp. 1201_B9_N1_2 TaxID=3240378 RepID=UPI003F26E4B0
MNPGALNDGTRGMMAAAAKYRDDISGAILTGGTSTAYTVSSYQGYDTLAHLDGAMIAFTPHATNGATVTLNVDGLGVKPLRGNPGVELPSNSLILGTPYVCTYNNTDGAFYLHGGMSNPYGIPIGGLMPYTGYSPPNSCFALPYGQALSRTVFAPLWTFAQQEIALGNLLYTNGNGSTTFTILDMRGRVGVASDSMGGIFANRVTTATFPTGGNVLGGVGGSEGVSLPQSALPNAALSASASGSASVISNETNVGLGTVAASSTGGGAANFAAFLPGAFSAQVTSTGSASVTGSTSSINGGVAQTVTNKVQPGIILNVLLRVM